MKSALLLLRTLLSALSLAPAASIAASEAKLNEHAEQPDRRPRGNNPPAAGREIERIHHPHLRPLRERAARIDHVHRAPQHRPSAGKRRRDDDDVALQRHRRRRAGDRGEYHGERVRVAAEPAPNHMDAQRADARADERDADEVSEEHDERADRAAAERGKDEQRPIAGAEHRRRGERADVKPEQREHESEKTIAGGPGDDAAENEQCERGKLIRRGNQCRGHAS